MTMLREFPNEDAWAEAVTDWLTTCIRQASSELPLVIVPGGTTPWPILRRVHELGLFRKARWSLTDERRVPLDDAARNERQLREALPGAEVIPLLDASGRIASESVAPPDVALIGMGEDGHIASLFPGSEALRSAQSAAAKDLLQVKDAPDGRERISRSLPGLIGAQGTGLIIRGSTKHELLSGVHWPSLPVGLIRNRTSGLFWCP